MQGYASQQEMLNDKSYINSMRGKADNKAIEKYNAKMKNTTDKVVFGR